MTPHLSLFLLGPFQANRDGALVEGFESDKTRALLAYLAVESDKPHRREGLADLLWPERTEQAARGNLRQALANLRRVLGERTEGSRLLDVSRQTVRIHPDARIWVDAVELERLSKLDAKAGPGSRETLDRLEQAAALYRGSFLEGLSIADAAPFEEWIRCHSERIHRQVMEALRRLIEGLCSAGEYERALSHAWRQLDLDPWREEAHRQAMRILALSGQRGAALAQYERCRQVLADELGAEPEERTIRLHEQIRAGAIATPADTASRFHAFLTSGTAPCEAAPAFAGREKELERLEKLLDEALSRQGRVAFVTGEAGSGKTYLVARFAELAQSARSDLVVAGGSGTAYTGVGDPYHPFREALDLLSGNLESRWRAGALTTEQAARLWEAAPLACEALTKEGTQLIDSFVPAKTLLDRSTAIAPEGAEWPSLLKRLIEEHAVGPGGPGSHQSALFAQYTQVLARIAARRPLLLILDDLQWADAGSVSLLFHLARRLDGSRILVIGAYRASEIVVSPGEARHPLEGIVHELARDSEDAMIDLDQSAGPSFIEAVLDREPNRLDSQFRDTLYRHTGGHALFTVELLRGMRDRNELVRDREGRWVEEKTLDWSALPSRVEAVVAERLSRIPAEARSVLRVASVQGETFSAEVVAMAEKSDPRLVIHMLDDELDRKWHLVCAHRLYRAGAQSMTDYRFRHGLFQKYLYKSLSDAERARLHADVGTALERVHEEQPDGVEPVCSQLAWHFEQGGRIDKAIQYLRQAGERAVRVSANEEAVAHLTRALALLETLPDAPERAQAELLLQANLIAPLQALRGYGDPQAGRACARARELCQKMGETPQVFPILWMLAIFHGARAELGTAHELMEQLLNVAERAGDIGLAILADFGCGWSLTLLGNPVRAQSHFERLIARYDLPLHRHMAFGYGQDVAVSARTFGSWVLWLLGYPEQALKWSREALTMAQELAHPPSLAIAQGICCMFHIMRRDVQTTLELSEALVQLSTKHGFEYWLTSGLFFHGWALAAQGQLSEGIAQMREGRTRILATGAESQHPIASAWLGQAYGRRGEVKEGLALLEEAHESARRNSAGLFLAEIHRIRGELLLMQGDGQGAEVSFQEALKVAKQQSARSWELRAAMSLCRLWHQQGKRQEARQVLSAIYGWFTEGFDTPDLQDAKELIEELA